MGVFILFVTGIYGNLRLMKKIITSLLACVGFASVTFSQSISENGCGTITTAEEQQRVYDFAAKGMPAPIAKGTGGVDSIPLSIHIVGKTNGTGYYELEKLFPLICNLNTHFAPVNFYFYIAWPITYINNDNYYEHDFSDGYQMMLGNNIANTVNVYFVQDPAGNCGYFSPGPDGVAIGKSCAAVNSTTLTHELGHFFGLPHTFSGWENGSTPSNPERVTRSGTGANCSFAGDGFCDTDADYLSSRWNCPYTGAPLTDPSGAAVTPDGTLYMSYADDACTNRFSTQQITYMQNNLYNNRSNLLQQSSAPYSTLDTPHIVYPTPMMYSNDKTVRWNKVPGAQYYFVKLSTQTLPNLYREKWITSDTFVQVTSQVFDNVSYYAYITPLTGKNVCSVKTRQQSFTYTDALSVKDILPDASIQIVPNPAADYVSVSADNSFKGKYSVLIMNMAGQIVKQQEADFNTSGKTVILQTSDLSNGIYTVRIAGEKGSLVKKLVVQH